MTDTVSTTSAPVISAPAPATEPGVAFPAAPEAPTRTLSLMSLLLSASAILIGMGPLAIAGIVAGFVARRDEPAHRTLSTWGIVLGFVSLFGWVLFAGIGVATLPFWFALAN